MMEKNNDKKVKLNSSDLKIENGKVIIESEELSNVLTDQELNLVGENDFLEESNASDIHIHVHID
ncbi:hypothetical protein UT300019_02700 [Clostridium sp. CTA-19]